jgi:V-type H+-transporting ATPase subunit d
LCQKESLDWGNTELKVFALLHSYSYMIDNIILLITGTLHHRPISELIPKCHPLGSFEQMEAIHVAATPAELYNAVLVDTPLGMYKHLVR